MTTIYFVILSTTVNSYFNRTIINKLSIKSSYRGKSSKFGNAVGSVVFSLCCTFYREWERARLRCAFDRDEVRWDREIFTVSGFRNESIFGDVWNLQFGPQRHYMNDLCKYEIRLFYSLLLGGCVVDFDLSVLMT